MVWPKGLFLGLDHLKSIQWERGCWVGEVVWCTMLLSQYIIVSHMIGQPIDPIKKEKYLKYYERTQCYRFGLCLCVEDAK